jgi:hypothetical protein
VFAEAVQGHLESVGGCSWEVEQAPGGVVVVAVAAAVVAAVAAVSY